MRAASWSGSQAPRMVQVTAELRFGVHVVLGCMACVCVCRTSSRMLGPCHGLAHGLMMRCVQPYCPQACSSCFTLGSWIGLGCGPMCLWSYDHMHDPRTKEESAGPHLLVAMKQTCHRSTPVAAGAAMSLEHWPSHRMLGGCLQHAKGQMLTRNQAPVETVPPA